MKKEYTFDCATIVADSAIELYEICLPHTYILCSFALFVYPFPLFLPLICIFGTAVPENPTKTEPAERQTVFSTVWRSAGSC